MKPVRVILLTLHGPSAQLDVAVRSDATLDDALPTVAHVIGLPPNPTTAAVSRVFADSPPRNLPMCVSLDDLRLVDGDIVILATTANSDRITDTAHTSAVNRPDTRDIP